MGMYLDFLLKKRQEELYFSSNEFKKPLTSDDWFCINHKQIMEADEHAIIMREEAIAKGWIDRSSYKKEKEQIAIVKYGCRGEYGVCIANDTLWEKRKNQPGPDFTDILTCIQVKATNPYGALGVPDNCNINHIFYCIVHNKGPWMRIAGWITAKEALAGRKENGGPFREYEFDNVNKIWIPQKYLHKWIYGKSPLY